MKNLLKRSLAVPLTVVMLLTAAPLSGFVFKAEAALSGYTVIWSPNDLDNIRNNLSGNYILANDIDMSNFGNWTPIGSDSTPFTGTLDGNGHSILNLTIDLHIDVPNGGIPVNAALFANVNGGIIKNLGMENANVSYFLVGSITNELTFCNASGFVGELVNSSIINCFFIGSVSAQTNYNSYVRASAFGNCVGSTITNCYSDADLSAKADYANTMVGGIASWNDSTTIDKCYATGTIYAKNTKSYVYCGGLVGSGSGTVSNSLALLDSITISGTSVVTGTNLTDTICAFSTLKNNKALNTLTSSVPNKSASLISLSQAKAKSTYTAMGWDFSTIWKIEGGYPELITNKEKYEEKLNNLEEMSTAELSNSQINNYINQHLNFIASNTYSEMLDYYRFENNLADKEDFYNKIAAAVTWDLIGDVGEMASLNFDDLTLCENPYTIVLADLITSYTASQTLEAACYNEALDVFDDTYDNFMKAIRTSNEWNESLAPKIEIEVKGILTDPNYRIQDKESFDVLKKILKGWSSDEIGEVFNLLNVANDIFDVVDTIGELDSAFTKAINAYVTASAFKTVSEEFVSTLIVIAYEMEPISSALFTDALGNYLDLIDGESAFNYALNNLGASLSWSAYDLVVKKLVQNISYSFVATAFGCAPSAVGIVVFAYNTTYSILNKISALGEKADLLYLIDAARQIEIGLYTNTLSAASTMQSDPTLSSAKLFDCRWGMLCALQKYEYNCATKYASKAMSTRFYKLFNPNYENSDMKIATELSAYWETAKCHGKNTASSKVCSVECPTNVIVRDSMGEIVLQIEGNDIIYCSEGIVVLVGEEHKYFSLPCNEAFDVEIVGTDEGTMNYSITEVMGSNTVREIKYKNLPLTTNTSYSGNVSEVIYEQVEEYNLESNGETIGCDIDSINTDVFTCNDLDWDNDGLTNLQEYDFGTNPLNSDTDGDNVYDIIEIRNDLNPLEPMTDGETDDYIVIYGAPDVFVDETLFFADETTVTCTISNNTDGRAMRAEILLYVGEEIVKASMVNLDANSSVEYSFSKEYLVENMRIVIDEGKITHDTDYSNNEFVYVPVSSITPKEQNITLLKNTSLKLEYNLIPENATDIVTWSVSDANVANVSDDGAITGLKMGTTQVIVTALSGVSCTYDILVEPLPGVGIIEYDCNLINSDKEIEISYYAGDDETVVIPDAIAGYPVNSIGKSAFENNTTIRSVTLSGNINWMDANAFKDCTALEEVNFIGVPTDIMDGAFQGCTSLKSVVIPEGTIYVSKNAFDGCTSLESVSLPNSLTYIGYQAFMDCQSLTEITIPENVTKIYAEAFKGCSALTTLNYNAIAAKYYTKLGDSTGLTNAKVFASCNLINDINIGEKVEELPGYFAYNEAITLIDIPRTMKKINRNAFSGSLLETVNYDGTRYMWRQVNVVTTALKNVTINCISVVSAKNNSVFDEDNGLVYGLDIGFDSLDDYVDVTVNGYHWEYTPTTNGLGTGSEAILTNGTEIIDGYTVVIFGDVDGNGWYDANDAFLVKMLVSGLLTREVVGEAVYKAADCNHDGAVDELDVQLLERASVLLDKVNQSATQAELESNSFYIEYCSVIDQSAGLEADSEPEEDTVQPPVETQPESEMRFDIEAIFSFIISIFEKMFTVVVSLIG